MLVNNLTIVPVTLDPLPEQKVSKPSPQCSSEPSCLIKTASAEISFFNGVDEHIIRTIMKELNQP